MNKKRIAILHSIAVFFVVWFSLLSRLAPHLTAGDAGELALAASTLGIAHPPGYPVFVLVHHLLSSLFHFGNVAYRQNLCSLFFMSASAALLGWTLFRFTGKWGLVYFPLILLFSPVFRHEALVTEVFPLTLFWASLILTVAVAFADHPKGLLILSFMFGLGLAVHQTLIFLYPAVLLFAIVSRRRTSPIHWREAALAGGFFLLGLTVQLFIPVRSFGDPVLDWENPETWDRFWGLVTRARYGFLQIAQGEAHRSVSFEAIGTVLDYARNKLVASAGWAGTVFLIVGTIACLSRRSYRRFAFCLWIFIICSGPFLFWMSGRAVLATQSAVMNRFLLLPLAGVVLIIGLGTAIVWETKITLYRWAGAALLALLIFEGAARFPPPVHANTLLKNPRRFVEGGDSFRWDWGLREVGENALRHLPKNSILISDRADEFEFVMSFLLGAEEKRPDVRFIDANAGVTPSIYGDDYYRIWGAPRLRRREQVETKLVETTDRTVFYATVDPSMVNVYRVSWGMLFRAVPLVKFRPPPVFAGDGTLTWRFNPAEKRADQVTASFLDQLGRYQFDEKEIDSALQSFGLAQRFGGTNRFEQIGFLYQVRRKNWEAAKYYRKALRAGAQSPSLFSNLGLLESARGRYTEAILLYKTGLKIYPDSVPLLYNLSTIYWRQNKWSKVVKLLGHILEIDPKHPEASWRYPKAKSLERFVSLQPQRKSARPPKPKPKAEPSPKPSPEPTPEPSADDGMSTEEDITGESGHGEFSE